KADRLVISAGGIMSPEEVKTRLSMGADLVQVYSALVFHGPFFIQQTLKNLTKPTRSQA
ncbi:MAG: quinone-dependent dihydroorotate dehydrogenase, partial [Bdellovibrionaceae bacterium]|nr:quinone-dependent dihydroorotate dehydrogenase [Pseudobdellovibrionaceae bacterium]